MRTNISLANIYCLKYMQKLFNVYTGNERSGVAAFVWLKRGRGQGTKIIHFLKTFLPSLTINCKKSMLTLC